MIDNVKYINLNQVVGDATGALKEEFEEWIHDNPHNNGYAKFFYIHDPKEDDKYCYPLINKFLIENGGEIEEGILFHSKW